MGTLDTSFGAYGAMTASIRMLATIAVGAVCLFSGSLAAEEQVFCAPDSGGTHDVARVIDGETLLLDDGREVRLMGSLKPGSRDPSTTSRDKTLAEQASQALAALVADRAITLRYEGRRRDRYGRVLAQVYVGDGSEAVWVQERLIGDGLARAYALPGNAGCITALMAAESAARAAGRGLWGISSYGVHAAEDVRRLLSLGGQFTLVEGRVASVTRAQRITYLNFGADWRRDFTASIANAVVDRSAGGAEALAKLNGRRVRVRGWIERRNGPMIVLNSPDEIETVDDAEAAAR